MEDTLDGNFIKKRYEEFDPISRWKVYTAGLLSSLLITGSFHYNKHIQEMITKMLPKIEFLENVDPIFYSVPCSALAVIAPTLIAGYRNLGQTFKGKLDQGIESLFLHTIGSGGTALGILLAIDESIGYSVALTIIGLSVSFIDQTYVTIKNNSETNRVLNDSHEKE